MRKDLNSELERHMAELSCLAIGCHHKLVGEFIASSISSLRGAKERLRRENELIEKRKLKEVNI